MVELIIEYGLYLLVFLLPWQTRWIIKAGELNGGFWEYGTYSLYASDILLFVLLVLFIIYQINELQITNYKLQIKEYWYLIAGLELIVFISIFFALDKGLAFFYYLRFLLGIGLFWLVISANYIKVKLIFSLILGIFLQAVLGIWQFLTQSSFADKWLGLALHNPSDLGVSVVETLSGERWLRAYGGLDHPNMLGGFLAISLLFIIFFITRLYNKKSFVNTEKQKMAPFIMKMSVKILILYSFFLIFIAALFFTFSRGAWAGFIAGLIVMLILAVIKKDFWVQIHLLKILLAGGILIFILFNLFSDLTLARLSQDTRLEVKSNTERIESYNVACEIIKNHWLSGTGIGNYTLAVRNELNNNLPSWAYQPVHNVFLLVWAETGVFGLLFFMFLIVYIIIFNFQSRVLGTIFKQFSINKFISLKFKYLFKIVCPAAGENVKLKINQVYSKNENLNFLNPTLIFSLLVMFLVDHWFWSLHFGVLILFLVSGFVLRENEVKVSSKKTPLNTKLG